MQKLEIESESAHNETNYSDLPDLISLSDDDDQVCDSDNIVSKTFQVFSRLSVLNHGIDKVTEEINNLRKESADITLIMQNLYLLLSKRTECGENIVLNMEENSDEGELSCEHFSSPLYTKIPSSDIRFYLEDDDPEDNEDNDNVSEEEENDHVSEEEDIQYSEDDEEVDDDPHGLGKSTIFD